MAEVHQTIIQYGIEAARSQAATKHERMLVDAAYRVLAEDAEKSALLTVASHSPPYHTSLKKKLSGDAKAII